MKLISSAFAGEKNANVVDAQAILNKTNVAHFMNDLEWRACKKVNGHFWMADPAIIQREATPALLHSDDRQGPLTRARRWCWFFLYRHPFTKGIGAPAIGRLYNRDHTTVLSGIKKIDHSLQSRPEAPEAQFIKEIADALQEQYGPFHVF